ncbi:AraC family transcriptional regulator [Pedobacter psychrodurus]|uniref:AraC family transcriptional regulator n=1 Tax=Pedobacter psychrodurus TaxID=2530456 RepID=A0A4R0Q5J6_9SPHI|nr:AraC family transcriptional regulator [Pedobacter psychrodurus]TCD28349.1 AraC family transcriptional regulator [Pedobacter psychrodurus]
MEPKFLQKNTRSAEHSFFCKYAEVPHTYDQFHYHKEYELLYTLENKGTRFIGDSVESFTFKDLVLIGPGLPHYWQSDKEYYEENPLLTAKVVLVHFEIDFVGNDFFNVPEMKSVNEMLSKANRGIHFRAEHAIQLEPIITGLIAHKGWRQVIDLIEILCEMAEKPYTLLASEGFSESYHGSNNEERITGIYNYMIKNHDTNISLNNIANYANMNPAAFCRYFKKATSKTFSDSLNDIRVGIACKKLINTELSIAEIGYACGYQSISYFNRQFKKVKRINPSEYRMKYLVNKH